MPRKFFFIIETILALAILVTIDLALVRGSSGYYGVIPHPYWIVVLLIASRYGTVPGLFAGGASAVMYILLAGQSGNAEFQQFTFPHGPYKIAFFFVLAGGILGEIRSLHKKILANVEKKYAVEKETLTQLTEEHEALVESKNELDKRVALQSSTMVTLFEKLTKLEQLSPTAFYEKIPGLLKDQLNVSCTSIYLVQDNLLRLRHREGSNPDCRLSDSQELTEGMMGEVVRSKGVVTINQVMNKDNFRSFENLGLIMSAPILRRDESLVGVINIERIPFFDFNSNTVKIFEMLSYWISIVVDRAIQFHHLKDKNIADEITGAFNYLYFQKRLAYEIARAKRFHSTISLILLKIRNFDDMLDTERTNVLVVLHWIFSNILREVDIVAKYKDESTFALVLPGQSSVGCDKIIERLSKEIDNYQMKPFEGREAVLDYEVGVSSLQVSEGSYESMIRTAEERLKFGGTRTSAAVFDDIDYLLGKDNEN